ncbi:MAG: YjbQ family protein [Nitrospirae bacterium]|nr:YjbQ family protein [Nitrospirota bacterium]
MMRQFEVRTGRRVQMLDITGEVQASVKESGVVSGVCHVFVPHTTAAVTINENADPSVTADMDGFLERLIPQDAGFRHVEGNSDGHIKSSLVGASETVFVENGHLVLGTWQGIYFCEFDGPRQRKVYVKVV